MNQNNNPSRTTQLKETAEIKLQHVAIVRPGGNNTALVFDNIDQRDYKKFNSYIQTVHPTVEQVMFIKNSPSLPQGIMAGGEFCGNATRSLGYYLLQGKDGVINLSISGTSKPLTVTVKDHDVRMDMPIMRDTTVQFLNNSVSIVRLEGITHLILEPGSPQANKIASLQSPEEKKSFAQRLLKEHGLLAESASGVMVLYINQSRLALTPFVYVRDIDTFFAETACCSGSVAAGLVFAKRQGQSIHNVEIQQPSGYSLFVDVDFVSGGYEKVSIHGNVDILYEGTL